MNSINNGIFRTVCRVLFFFVVVCGGAGVWSAAAQSPRRIRVLTYNIRWGERADIEALSAVIKKTDPDLVALQEVEICVKHPGKVKANNVHQISQFARFTGMHALFGPAFRVKRYPFGYGGGEFGNAVLSKYAFDSTRRHVYSAKGTEYRIGLETWITFPDGKRLRFISTHLDHNNNAIRRSQVDEICRVFANDTIPTLLCGDFNERPDDPNGCIARMERVWRRACHEENTFIAWNPTVKLDYVFCRPEGCWRVVCSRVIDDSGTSDHRPLLVELELSDSSEVLEQIENQE